MYIFLLFSFFAFGALYFGQLSCIYIWDVQTLVFVYMTFMVSGLYLWLVFTDCVWLVYGLCLWIVFMAMCLDCMGTCMGMCL